MAMLAEIIEEPKSVDEEAVKESEPVVQEQEEVLFAANYDEELVDNYLFYGFKSIIPPELMSSFAGLFETQGRYCRMEEEERKKKQVDEIIYVNKEMTVEYLAKIVDKAMMEDLKEVVNKAESE
ncbi:hypothetical protein Hanom_Chr04g00337641 [Helianthus anomalus]